MPEARQEDLDDRSERFYLSRDGDTVPRIAGGLSMGEEHSRQDVLERIRKAEEEGARLEAEATERAARMRADAQAKAARMSEEADKEGRDLVRKTLEAARAECDAAREAAVKESGAADDKAEARANGRIPEASKLIFREFKKEFDAED